MDNNYDFCGWATKYGIRCSDGRTIKHGAFKDQDGKKIPLVWNHNHTTPSSTVGYGILQHRDEGMYCYGYFNESPAGQDAREAVRHKDIEHLSIFANGLQQVGPYVEHGILREVSLVYAGANPGALIDSYMGHSEDCADEAMLYTDEFIELPTLEEIKHADTEENKVAETINNTGSEVLEHAAGNEKTVKDVWESLTEEQQTVVSFIVGELLKEQNKENKDMAHNAFDTNSMTGADDTQVLSHSEMEAIFSDAEQIGSLKNACLAHGITNIEYLFPDAKAVKSIPDFIGRDMEWVGTVINGAKHVPFEKIKSIHANITADEARAKGFIKGNEKTDEQFVLLTRSTDAQMVYKKQSMDRDDMISITDFDKVAWLKGEMRLMLNEEVARAALIGDGRSVASPDKIKEDHIRPIWTDAATYTINQDVEVAANASTKDVCKAFIRAARMGRKDYRGSGNPTLYTTEDFLTELLLMEDEMGHILYEDETKLAKVLRVKNIVTVPVMEGKFRTVEGVRKDLLGIIVNMNDYAFGTNKGGEVTLFDDFDIDYNKEKYLLETRMSGALIVPYSAIALEKVTASGD